MFGVLLLSVVALAVPALSSYIWPNYLYDELEHLLVDQEGFNRGAYFKGAITPCTNYVNGNQTLGRMTAAQWLRTAFHDYATANVSDGTGGIDASIGWETDRPENVGSAFNDSLSFFAPFVNQYVSMADMIALSVVTSVGVCSSPSIHIPFRGGRIDASGGGTFGVPEPETDIQTTLNQFAQTGFNQQDAIALTACGHTLGNVHHGGFPQVVGPEAVTPNNTGGGVHFDSTVDVFDVLVVNEYLEGVGQQGGPLVTTDNVTVRSDLRLYLSDNNTTMKDLSTSQRYFISQCVSLFARMLETVPSVTTLSDVIEPLEVKPINITLDLVQAADVAQLVFAGYIRILSTNFTENANVTISWLDRNGKSAPAYIAATQYIPSEQKGGGMFGDTFFHAFNTTIDPALGISAFEIIIEDTNKQGISLSTTTFKNGGNGYPVQDHAFIMEGDSTIDEEGTAKVIAAILSTPHTAVSNVSIIFSFPVPQIGTMGPKIITQASPLQLTSSNAPINATSHVTYTTSESLPLSSSNAYQVTVDLTAVFEDGEVVTDNFRRLKIQ